MLLLAFDHFSEQEPHCTGTVFLEIGHKSRYACLTLCLLAFASSAPFFSLPTRAKQYRPTLPELLQIDAVGGGSFRWCSVS